MGSGAVGSPLKKLIKSGNEKNPARTKNKKDSLFKTPKSLKDNDPYIKKIIPMIVRPNTKLKVSNILIASADGASPNASETRPFSTSGIKRPKMSGIA